MQYVAIDVLSCADPERRTPLNNHKAIGFFSNTGPDPLENNKATKPVFNVSLSGFRIHL